MSEKTSKLHIKYRPKSFDEMYGNEATIEALRTLADNVEGFPSAIMLIGPSGCGKTTIGRIIKTILECSDFDFKEYNSADLTGVDTIRDINSTCKLRPMMGKSKVYLLDEFHKVSNAAQNAILKTLEDTPKHAYFIIATTDPAKIIKTVKTRCMEFTVSPLHMREMKKLLNDTYKKEGLDPYPGVVDKIARVCEGSPRKALVLLGQVIDIEDEEQAKQAVESITIEESKVIDLCRILIKNGNRWKEASSIINKLKEEPESIRYAILGYMGKVLLNKGDLRTAQIVSLFLESYMYKGKTGLIYSCFMACKL